jgi:hypothetical protein
MMLQRVYDDVKSLAANFNTESGKRILTFINNGADVQVPVFEYLSGFIQAECIPLGEVLKNFKSQVYENYIQQNMKLFIERNPGMCEQLACSVFESAFTIVYVFVCVAVKVFTYDLAIDEMKASIMNPIYEKIKVYDLLQKHVVFSSINDIFHYQSKGSHKRHILTRPININVGCNGKHKFKLAGVVEAVFDQTFDWIFKDVFGQTFGQIQDRVYAILVNHSS